MNGGGLLYTLAPKCAPGKALDVSGSSPAAGAQEQLWTANGSAAQRFKFTLPAVNAAVLPVSAVSATASATSGGTDEKAALSVYPNPSAGQATLSLRAQAAPQRTTMYLHNPQGHLMGLFTVSVLGGGQATKFKVPFTLAEGTYYIQTKLDNQLVKFTLKVVR